MTGEIRKLYLKTFLQRIVREGETQTPVLLFSYHAQSVLHLVLSTGKYPPLTQGVLAAALKQVQSSGTLIGSQVLCQKLRVPEHHLLLPGEQSTSKVAISS